MSGSDFLDYVADLIEPEPVCKNEFDGTEDFQCSKCGYGENACDKCGIIPAKWSYCPYCGCEVVGES